MTDSPHLQLKVVASDALAPDVRDEVIALCDLAFGQPMAPYLADIAPVAHVIGRVDGKVAAHACWATRFLKAGDGPPMRTAYAELVATHPDFRRRGYASVVMRALADAIQDYDLAALSPSEEGQKLYPALGWQVWRGSLHIRRGVEQVPTPGECVMVLRLSDTPPLDLDASLSAEWRPGELW